MSRGKEYSIARPLIHTRLQNMTRTTAALEARNLKTAYQVYIVDEHYRFFNAVSSIYRAHDMSSRRYILLLFYILLLCHRIVRHALTGPRNTPARESITQNRPRYVWMCFLPPVRRSTRTRSGIGDGKGRRWTTPFEQNDLTEKPYTTAH